MGEFSVFTLFDVEKLNSLRSGHEFLRRKVYVAN